MHLHVQIADRRGYSQPGNYDTKYEIKRRGRHVLNVTLHGKHVAGSPIEFFSIPCRPDGRRWEPGEKEKAERERLAQEDDGLFGFGK